MTYREQQLKEVEAEDENFYKTLCKSKGYTVPPNDAAEALGVSHESLRRAMETGWDRIGYIYFKNGRRQCKIIRRLLIGYYEQNKISGRVVLQSKRP